MKSNSEKASMMMPRSVVRAPWVTGANMCSRARCVLRSLHPILVTNPWNKISVCLYAVGYYFKGKFRYVWWYDVITAELYRAMCYICKSADFTLINIFSLWLAYLCIPSMLCSVNETCGYAFNGVNLGIENLISCQWNFCGKVVKVIHIPDKSIFSL
jgi:hypothetical protein